jgi:maleate isomerase
MSRFAYDLDPPIAPAALGLVVLQSDETLEHDFRRLFGPDVLLYVSRIPSGLEVTTDSLGAMEAALPAAAGLLPRPVLFDAVGYGCTSATSVIGADRVAKLVGQGCTTRHVTEPVSGLIDACRDQGLTRLAFLSPYVENVSRHLRDVLAAAGIATPVFGSFDEGEEAKVARIAPASIRAAAVDLATRGEVDGIFLSCTNLRTLDILVPIAEETGLPVMSSNQVMARHMAKLAGLALPDLD